MADGILNSIWQKIVAAWLTLFAPFQWLIDWSPMFGHFTLFVVFLLVCGFVARFLPDKLKLWLGGVVLLAGAFVAGETYRFKRTLDETKAEKAAERKREEEEQPHNNQGGFWGNWGGR